MNLEGVDMAKQKTFAYQYACSRCRRSFFMIKHRGGYQSYCPECRVIVGKERNRERVRRWREKHRQPVAARSYPLYTHIEGDTFYVTFFGPPAWKPISELFNIRAGL
jgi:DNA-directed RNA polymerase subunit RPC12/RpoP